MPTAFSDRPESEQTQSRGCTFAFVLPDELMAKITEKAKREGVPKAYIVRAILRLYFKGKLKPLSDEQLLGD